MQHKIGFRRRKRTRNVEPLFVAVNKFEVEGFPVRVRHFRLGQTQTPDIALETSGAETATAGQANWQASRA
jgi:hypothetical protein